MSLRWRSAGRLSILDFDCEARPLSWIGGDFVSKEITAIACKFVDLPAAVAPSVWMLGQGYDAIAMLQMFRTMYDGADMVTGHWITGFDLPMLNGAMLEHGLASLGPKLVHDTKQHLVKRSGISASQESLGAMLGLSHPKVGMNQTKWRDANRLKPEGLRFTRERVAGDVLQHIELRQRLIELGYLGPPRVWTPGGGIREAAYTP